MNEPEDIKQLDEIRNNIKRIRAEKNLTVRDLAARADMEPSVIQRFVSGQTFTIDTINLIKIARGLGVTLEELVRVN